MFGVDSSIPDDFESFQGMFLIASNFFFFVLVAAALHKKAPFLAAFTTLMAINSMTYHICSSGWACMTRRDVLANTDFILAWCTTALVMDFVLAWDTPRLKGRFILLRDLLMMTTFVIIVLRVLINREADATFWWITGALTVVTVVKIAFVDRWIYLKDYDALLSFIGISLSMSGIALFYFVPSSYYWATHSIWHILVGLGGAAYVWSRKVPRWGQLWSGI